MRRQIAMAININCKIYLIVGRNSQVKTMDYQEAARIISNQSLFYRLIRGDAGGEVIFIQQVINEQEKKLPIYNQIALGDEQRNIFLQKTTKLLSLDSKRYKAAIEEMTEEIKIGQTIAESIINNKFGKTTGS